MITINLQPVFWILSAALLGFGISAVFSSWLKLPRRIFLVPYIGLGAVFLVWFYASSNLSLNDLISKNWIWGVVAGVIVSIFLVSNVRSQPTSRQSAGGEFAFDLVWLGFVYGLMDALFLNVMPVLAVWLAFPQVTKASSWIDKLGVGVLALFASLLVALTYHLGYQEYRNRSVGLVLIGNSLITLAFLLSSNPLGAIISHIVMHIAATIQGPETTLQLPPHSRAIS
jgi:hypothetical protein